MEIIHVRSDAEADEVRLLVHDYVGWLRQIYPGEEAALEGYFRAQGLEEQLRNLLTVFCPPHADCLPARIDGAAAGVVTVKRRSEGICEMNRMYVRDAARGRGVGRALVAELLETARGLGYRQMMLAAGPQHDAAIRLYEGFGFARDDSLPDTGGGDIEVRMMRAL